MANRKAQILLVDDNPAEAELVKLSYRKQALEHHIHHVETGKNALDFLRKNGVFSGCPNVDVVMLDLNLPDMNGHEVLTEIRNDPQLTQLPVIVLTNSTNPADVDTSYALHANCCLAKPAGFEALITLVQKVEEFWFQTAILPK